MTLADFFKHADHDQKTHGRRNVRTQDQRGDYFGDDPEAKLGEVREIVGWFEGDDEYPIAGYIKYVKRPDESIYVLQVQVEGERRRQGVASALMNELEAKYENIEHSPRTEEGEAWWRSRKVEKHADHDQKTHGNWARQQAIYSWTGTPERYAAHSIMRGVIGRVREGNEEMPMWVDDEIDPDDWPRILEESKLLWDLRNEDEITQPLYRGLFLHKKFSARTIEKLKPGGVLSGKSVVLNSFTPQQDLAAQFARGDFHFGSPGDDTLGVILKIENGRGLDLTPFLEDHPHEEVRGSKEWLVTGPFEIVSVDDAPFGKQVTVRQVEEVAKHLPGQHDQSTHGHRAGSTWVSTLKFQTDVSNSILRPSFINAETPEGKPVGFISWDNPGGVIDEIRVGSAYRRRGVATELLRRAREINPSLTHDFEHLSPEGKAFASVVKIKKHLPGQHDQKTHGNRTGTASAPHLTQMLNQFADLGSIRHKTIRDLGRPYKAPSPSENLARMDEWSVEPGIAKECFRNAALEATLSGDDSLTYVEGYAITDRVPFPIHHAWLVTPDGDVIDPTWHSQSIMGGTLDPGIEYYGIEFPSDWLRRRMVSTEVWGVFQGVQEGPLHSGVDIWNEFPGRRESGVFRPDKTGGSGRHIDPNRRVVDRTSPFAGVDEEYEEGDGIHKHAAPIHPGTGSNQDPHGSWADGMGGDRDAGTKSKPESQIFGQTTFPGTRIATPDQSFETWMRHVESLEDAPPEGWTPQVLKDALAKMKMEDVTPEFRSSVDETLGKVLVEPKIERFRRKYGNATWLTATKTLDGIDAENAGMNGQYLSEAGGQIVVYEHVWTEGEKFLKEDEFNGVHKGFDGDEVRLPIQSGSGMAHVLRHEFGHHIHSEISPADNKKFRDLFYAAMRNIGADGQLMGGTLGKDQGRQYDWYTKDGVGGKFVSTYGMTNEREGFAEVFSAVTHPDYDRSVYDPSLHDLLDLVEGLA